MMSRKLLRALVDEGLDTDESKSSLIPPSHFPPEQNRGLDPEAFWL